MSELRLFCFPLAAGRAELDVAEAHHAADVRRLRSGERVVLFDGQGHEADAVLVEAESRRVVVDVGPMRSVSRPSRRHLVIAVAPPKPPRQDMLVEKCTELGVAAIQPLATERGICHVDAARRERWRRIAVAAAKQSRQAWLPDILPERTAAEVLSLRDPASTLLLADPSPDALPLATALPDTARSAPVLLLIGPEGGFTEAERAAALAAGGLPVRLTPTLLRVETAAIAAAAVILSF